MLVVELIRWPIAFAIMILVYVGGFMLRRSHFIVCRTWYKATLASMVVMDLWIAGTAWLIWGLGNGVGDIVFFTVFNFIYPAEPGFRPLWRQVKRHRDHDEDCEYGPRRHHGGVTVRLRQWRKLSLNPVFAPT